jgi:hypothetical protein
LCQDLTTGTSSQPPRSPAHSAEIACPLSHHESDFPSLDFKATELIRGFLLHVLPLCFVRIRHYGFLANRVRQEKLALCRLLLNDNAMPETISVSKRAGRGTWRGECLRIVWQRLAGNRRNASADTDPSKNWGVVANLRAGRMRYVLIQLDSEETNRMDHQRRDHL